MDDYIGYSLLGLGTVQAEALTFLMVYVWITRLSFITSFVGVNPFGRH